MSKKNDRIAKRKKTTKVHPKPKSKMGTAARTTPSKFTHSVATLKKLESARARLGERSTKSG